MASPWPRPAGALPLRLPLLSSPASYYTMTCRSATEALKLLAGVESGKDGARSHSEVQGLSMTPLLRLESLEPAVGVSPLRGRRGWRGGPHGGHRVLSEAPDAQSQSRSPGFAPVHQGPCNAAGGLHSEPFQSPKRPPIWRRRLPSLLTLGAATLKMSRAYTKEICADVQMSRVETKSAGFIAALAIQWV